METESAQSELLITLTSDIVAAHVSNNSVAVSDVATLIQNVSPYSPHEEPPIAYFDVVPQQDVTGVFNMGAVAYHLEGVDRVEYTIHREGFVGDWNRDGITDGDDLAVLLQRWGQGLSLIHI